MKKILLLLSFLPLSLWGQKFQLIVVSKQYQIPIGLEFVGKVHVLCEGNCFYTIDSLTSDKGTISQNTEGVYEIHIPSENPNHSSQTTRKYKIHAVMRVGEERIAVDMQGDFEAIQPEIHVYNAGVTALYRNCLNNLHFSVPPFWKDRDLIVVGSPNLDIGHRIMPKGEEGKATIEIKRLEKGGKMLNIGTLTFGVIDPPHPEMYMYANGKRIQSGDKVSVNDKIAFTIIPDKDFGFELPNDALYGITKMEVFEKYKGGNAQPLKVFVPQKEQKTIGLSNIDIALLANKATAKEDSIKGDEWGFSDKPDNNNAQEKTLTFTIPPATNANPRAFIFTIPEIYRRNGKGQYIKEDMPPQKFVLYEKK